MLAQIGAIPTPSSVGSIANAKHPVDDIVENTPCVGAESSPDTNQ
jgi:hypothetical protein